MRITFLLPSFSSSPIGGYRVHYEYANRLSRRGHIVAVVHLEPRFRRRMGIRRRGAHRCLRWFPIDGRVRMRLCAKYRIPRSDVLVLTSFDTAEVLPRLQNRAQSSVQIVYDFETWATADAALRSRMATAFRLPQVSIATSRAVAAMLREAGREPDALVPCGLDISVFHQLVDPSVRSQTVGVISRADANKGCREAFLALDSIRSLETFDVLALGVAEASAPPWVHRARALADDEMCDFYNRVAVFLLPSFHEGWGLPAAEAMACGAAVVATRSGGVEDFAEHEVNALLVDSGDVEGIAAAVLRLLRDPELRVELARQGLETIHRMDWGSSVDAVERVMISAMSAGRIDARVHDR